MKPSFALTFDVEPNVRRMTGVYGKWSGLETAAPALLDLLQEYGIPCTWFVTHDSWAQIDRSHRALVERMAANGEIGCHVHFAHHDHVGNNDRYDVSAGFQRQALCAATESLRSLGFTVSSFRGGAGYFDANTLSILEELEYRVDSSVLPGLYSGNRFPGLVVDHRRCALWHPYHPSRRDYCVPGDSRVLEIPVFRYPVLQLTSRRFRILGYLDFGFKNFLVSPSRAMARVQVALEANRRNHALVLTYHIWDLLPQMETLLTNLRNFLQQSKDMGFGFCTLSEIAEAYRDKQPASKDDVYSYNVAVSLDPLNDLRSKIRFRIRYARGKA